MTVGVRGNVSPIYTEAEVWFRVTPVTATVTVTEQDAVKPPSAVVTEMTAEPFLWAVTPPFWSTEATEVSLLDHDRA